MQTRLLAILATSLFLATPFWAQTFGDISGEVKDATGAVVPGAKVVVSNPSKGIARNLETNAEGYFLAPSLPPAITGRPAGRPAYARVSGETLV